MTAEKMVPDAHGSRIPDHRRQEAEASGSPFPALLGRRLALLLGVAFVVGMGMTAVVLWLTGVYFGDDMPLSGTAFIAAMLGGGGAMAVGAGLMGALFYSDQSRWDEKVR